MSWTINLPFDDDTVYFAYCYPYTYTNLIEDLDALARDPVRGPRCRQRALCNTLAGNMCPLLTITSFGAAPEEMAQRKVSRHQSE